MERKRFPIGVENFEALITGGYLYVDKTRYVHDLISSSKYYLLCRPRRFGKSLLLSTLEAFFLGKRDLFDGLAISKMDVEWKRRPVFHLNFVNLDASSGDELRKFLNTQFDDWDKVYGINSGEKPLPQRFQTLIEAAYAQTGERAVILIDEYDKPLVTNLDNERLNEELRNILKPVYANLKRCDGAIAFALLTGVGRFSRLSIFSDLNNLRDISMLDRYSAICGITEEELEEYCRFGVEALAEESGMSFRETLEALKSNYDGYHFSEKSPDIYNPYSLFTALENRKIGAYWYTTGTPSFLMKQLRKSRSPLSGLLNEEADERELQGSDFDGSHPLSLLYQTGYLTIKGYDPEFETYRLGLPNQEVAKGFFEGLLPCYLDTVKNEALEKVRDLYRDIREGNAEGFVKRLRTVLAGVPYHLSNASHEVYFENNLYIIFSLLGFYTTTEYQTSNGRIDILIDTPSFIYVIELKLDKSAEEALRQINEKDYCLPFSFSGKKVFKIGLNFSSRKRNIDDWKIEEC